MQMYSNHDESVGERICFGVLYYDSDVIVDKTRLGWTGQDAGFLRRFYYIRLQPTPA